MKNFGCKNHKIKIEKKKIIKLYDTIGMIIDQVVAMSESPVFLSCFSTWFMAVDGHEDISNTTQSLLYMSAPPIYLFLDHTQTTPPASA